MDANTGRIVSKKDRAIKEGKHKRDLPGSPDLSAAGVPADREAALAKFNQRMKR